MAEIKYANQEIYDQFGLNHNEPEHMRLVTRYLHEQEALEKGAQAIEKTRNELEVRDKYSWISRQEQERSELRNELQMLQDAQRTVKEDFDRLRINMQISGIQYDVRESEKQLEKINLQIDMLDTRLANKGQPKEARDVLQEQKEKLMEKIQDGKKEIAKLEAVQKVKDLFNEYDRSSDKLTSYIKDLTVARVAHEEAQKDYEHFNEHSLFRHMDSWRKPRVEKVTQTWEAYCEISNKVDYTYADMSKTAQELQKALDELHKLDPNMLQIEGFQDAVIDLNPRKWHSVDDLRTQADEIKEWQAKSNDLQSQLEDIAANDNKELSIQELTSVIAGITTQVIENINLDSLTQDQKEKDNLVPIKDRWEKIQNVDKDDLVPIKDKFHDNALQDIEEQTFRDR